MEVGGRIFSKRRASHHADPMHLNIAACHLRDSMKEYKLCLCDAVQVGRSGDKKRSERKRECRESVLELVVILIECRDFGLKKYPR